MYTVYEYLRGKLIAKKIDYVVLDVNGIGYAIKMGTSLQEQLEDKEFLLIYCSLQVRENSQELFGFVTEEQKQLFEILLTVSGIGPKNAMKIISEVRPQDLILAILKEDSKKLNKEYKITAKMAQRLVVELKDRVKKLNVNTTMDSEYNSENSETLSSPFKTENSIIDDIFTALLMLGYSDSEIKKMIKLSYDKTLTIEENIQKILKERSLNLLK